MRKCLSHNASYLGSHDSLVNPTDWKRGNITLIFKREEERPGELQANQSHLSTWQGHVADPPGKYAKANGKQGSD